MSPILYRKVQEQIDQYSAGFPARESGIEIQILERLFTVKEAEIFLQLGFLPEPSDAIYLEARSRTDRYEPPKTEVDFYIEMARMRGKTLFPGGSVIKE